MNKISNYINTENINFYSFTIPQLKSFLKEIGEKITGNKPILVERLYNYILVPVNASKEQRNATNFALV